MPMPIAHLKFFPVHAPGQTAGSWQVRKCFWHVVQLITSNVERMSQDSLQAAQEGEMVERLSFWGGRQSWEGLGCEQESQLRESVVRCPRQGQGKGPKGAADWTLSHQDSGK